MTKPFATIMEYLEQGQYMACLRLAEQSMVGARLTTQDLGRLQGIICRCRIQLGDHLGALSAAHMAEQLTRDEPDLQAVRVQALLDLLEIHLYLGRYDEAIKRGQELIDKDLLGADRNAEATCWRDLGVCYKHVQRFPEAIEAFQNAQDRLDPADTEGLLTIRSYLIKTHAAAGSLAPIPALLAQSEAYVQDHPDDLQAKVAHLWDAAEYQFALGHLKAATQLAELALSFADRYSWHRYHCRMLLGRIALASRQPDEALRHIMTARAIAMQGHHYDLEADATDMMYTVIRSHPEAVTGDRLSDRHNSALQQGARAH